MKLTKLDNDDIIRKGDLMFQNSKIFILGMARSGYEAAKFLATQGNQIFVTDLKDQSEDQKKELLDLGVSFEVLEHPEDVLDKSYSCLIKNPGIRKDHPCVLKAKELGIPVINEMEMAYHFLPQVTIVGITGSNGKTTTTTLLYEMIKRDGKRVHLGGNIGYPLSSLLGEIETGDILVLEISDHQLVDFKDFKTNISIMTNLSEVHLDFHGTYDIYKQVKKKIFEHHTDQDLAIINSGDSDVIDLTSDIPSKKITFSALKEADIFISENMICYQNENVISLDEIKLKGNHNYENFMCACVVALKLGVSMDSIKEVAHNFGGVEHRLEYVRTIDGVSYYNDSKATNIESTIIAVNSFKNPIHLILGGLDRGHAFEPLNPYLGHVKEIYCYGETKDRIADWADTKKIPVHVFDTLKEATICASNQAENDEIVLLSPACASWDQYPRFEDRGDEFKNIVNNI